LASVNVATVCAVDAPSTGVDSRAGGGQRRIRGPSRIRGRGGVRRVVDVGDRHLTVYDPFFDVRVGSGHSEVAAVPEIVPGDVLPSPQSIVAEYSLAVAVVSGSVNVATVR